MPKKMKKQASKKEKINKTMKKIKKKQLVKTKLSNNQKTVAVKAAITSKTNILNDKVPLVKKPKLEINVDLLRNKLSEVNTHIKKREFKNLSLRERMLLKLKGARFRYLNEEMYTREGRESMKLFESDPEAFQAYHHGYRLQVKQWPVNPLDVIIEHLNKLPADLIVADFGCGDARLAASVSQKVHSFDLIALNSRVTACDMAHCPLRAESVDVVVFCLSLMGTNIRDFLTEANRVLKPTGILKIAEVESRFDKVDDFVEAVQRFGFKLNSNDYSYNLFYFFQFTKLQKVKNKKKLPTVSLHPCLYKKR